jgi:MoaA/NifB/PqqE/SkfB family radical SAM enzyme
MFLWNDEGRHNYLAKENARDELSLEAFEKVMKSTEKAKSNLFFWGTEPLLHSEWDAMTRLMEKDCRWTVICTNAY